MRPHLQNNDNNDNNYSNDKNQIKMQIKYFSTSNLTTRGVRPPGKNEMDAVAPQRRTLIICPEI